MQLISSSHAICVGFMVGIGGGAPSKSPNTVIRTCIVFSKPLEQPNIKTVAPLESRPHLKISITSPHFPMANTLEKFAQLEPLWDKAIQSSAEISTEEKHRMMEWPPRAEMEATTQKALGISVDELVQKAAMTPESLTYPECRLIRDNFRMLGYRDLSDRWEWPFMRPDLQTKKRQAEEAALPSLEREAIRNLNDVFCEKETTELGVRHAKRKPLVFGMPPEWIQRIIDQGDDKSWGYVFYHHKDIAGWNEFLELFNSMLDMGPFLDGTTEIKDFKLAQFILFETAESDIGHLRQ